MDAKFLNAEYFKVRIGLVKLTTSCPCVSSGTAWKITQKENNYLPVHTQLPIRSVS